MKSYIWKIHIQYLSRIACVSVESVEYNLHLSEVWSPAERVHSEGTLALLLRLLSFFLQLTTGQIQTAVYLEDVI